MGKLDGKVAFITGAGSGIGRASTLLFLEEGCKVYASDISDKSIKETYNLCNQNKKNNLIIQTLDVSIDKQVEKAIINCIEKFDSVDIVFANAGVVESLSIFHEIEEEEMLRTLKVNVLGVLFCFKHAAKYLIKTGKPGSFISTASVAGIRSGAGPTAYSASKAAVINMTQTIANQLTGTGIRCNCIAPGIIETGMTTPIFTIARNNGSEKRIGQLNALLRYGNPNEIAKPALFLASDDSSYVNGQCLPVDGGLSSSHPVAIRKKGTVSL